jgi:hypothetical protein
MKNKYQISFIVVCGLFLVGNFVSAAELIPNDPDYYKQLYLGQLNLPQVWAQAAGENQVVIAVLDSGVDLSHPDLHDNIWVNQAEILGDNLDNDNNGYIDDINGWDFIEKNNDPNPKYELDCLENYNCIEEAIIHGTFVAGVAAAVTNNGYGIAGISWHAKIMPLRVLAADGSGRTEDVIEAINYAVANGADIINLSFVGDSYDKRLEKALDQAWQAGVVIVAAAGNETYGGRTVDLDKNKLYPVCFKGTNGEDIIIGVGASTQAGKLADFSNYGSSCLDIIAPGENFWGAMVYDPAMNFKQYFGGDFSGTSVSVPVISGLAALIESYNPSLTNLQIRDLFYNNADSLQSDNPLLKGKLGHGLVDPVKIWQSLKQISVQTGLIKGFGPTVYYQAIDGKRYVFPNSLTYLSWFNDFNGVKQISAEQLAVLPLGGNVTVKPGSKLVKIVSDPKVYAVSRGGVLRWITTEDLARQLYGLNWQSQVVDISDAFFINYQIGPPIANLADYNPYQELNSSINIDYDKNLLAQ